jgi:hypothetical protein
MQKDIILKTADLNELAYAEECMLYHSNAIISKDYINGNIRSKVFRTWVKREQFQADLIRLKLNYK